MQVSCSTDSSAAQARCNMLRQWMAAMDSPRFRAPEGFYNIEKHGDAALLVEPLNAAPFVFVPSGTEFGTVFEFNSLPGNGADKLRMRTLAALQFKSVVDAAELSMARSRDGSAQRRALSPST